MRKIILIHLTVAASLASLIAVGVSLIALGHNPQEEFCRYVSEDVSNWTTRNGPCELRRQIFYLFSIYWSAIILLYLMILSLVKLVVFCLRGTEK